MKDVVGTIITTAALILTPLSAEAGMAPQPGEPGYDPNVPTYKETRTIWLRHPDGHQVRIDLTEANESHHYDYLTVHGPYGLEYIKTKCIDGTWVRRGVYTNTSLYLDKLTNTLCGNQIRT